MPPLPGARETDPEAEMARQAIRRDLRVVDEIHRAVTQDGRAVYAHITVTVSDAHPLPRQLLADLMGALRDSWEEGHRRAGA